MSDQDLVSVQVEIRPSVPSSVLRWLRAALDGSPIPAAFDVEVFDGDALESAAFLLGRPHARLEPHDDGWLLSLQCVAHDDLRPGLFALLLAVAPSSVDGLVATSRPVLGDSGPDLYFAQSGTLFVGPLGETPMAVVADPANGPAWQDAAP